MYPTLYETAIAMQVGEVRLIHDKTASFIIRCDAVRLFDSCKDSEELKQFARELYATEAYQKARYSDEYKAELASAYRSVKIIDFVTEGKAHYGR